MPETRTGYLGLGSNVGDPAAHLRAAVLRVHGVAVVRQALAVATAILG